jgi:hypothetical protein
MGSPLINPVIAVSIMLANNYADIDSSSLRSHSFKMLIFAAVKMLIFAELSKGTQSAKWALRLISSSS